MTDKIEQEFFECYGVESLCKKRRKQLSCNPGEIRCENCLKNGNKYPQITSDKLLKIICILSKYIQDNNDNDEGNIELYEIGSTNIEQLKEEVLIDCIDYVREIEFEKYKNEIKEIIEGE